MEENADDTLPVFDAVGADADDGHRPYPLPETGCGSVDAEFRRLQRVVSQWGAGSRKLLAAGSGATNARLTRVRSWRRKVASDRAESGHISIRAGCHCRRLTEWVARANRAPHCQNERVAGNRYDPPDDAVRGEGNAWQRTRKTPVTRKRGSRPAETSSSAEIDAFVRQARTLGAPVEGRGRLIFALDATMSRQPTWDTACRLQAEMFEEAGKVGGLEVQLALLPRLRRMPGQPLGQRHQGAPRPDDRHRCPRRPDPDRQGAQPRAPRSAGAEGRGDGLRRRRARGADRRAGAEGGRARPARG